MSLSESENLLRGADSWEATKAGWLADLQILGIVVAGFIGTMAVLFIAAAIFGPVIAAVAFIAAVIYWHNRPR